MQSREVWEAGTATERACGTYVHARQAGLCVEPKSVSWHTRALSLPVTRVSVCRRSACSACLTLSACVSLPALRSQLACRSLPACSSACRTLCLPYVLSLCLPALRSLCLCCVTLSLLSLSQRVHAGQSSPTPKSRWRPCATFALGSGFFLR